MKTFVIADIGTGHCGSSSRARTLIDEAKKCGCDAVKFQTYVTEKILATDDPNYDAFKRNELSVMQQKGLKEYADEIGIEIVTSPLDEESLSFSVNDLGINRIKTSSFDLKNTKFLSIINECGKKNPGIHVMVSTGMANNWLDVQNAIDCFTHVAYLSVMHCTTSYPVAQQDTNLELIKSLKQMVHGPRTVGYSDHTDSILIPAAAVLVGATIIQKHLVLNKGMSGPDTEIAADPQMMRAMVNLIRTYEAILGEGEFKIRDSEKEFLQRRRVS